MQTKQQIQELLAAANFSPNTRRGQNFLIDLNLMRLLLEVANIRNSDIVLEVGPGTGSLTQELVRRAGWVVTVEIERKLAEITKQQLHDAENVQVIVTDALQSKNTIDASVMDALKQAKSRHSGRLMLVANLPYGVACPVMLNLVTGDMVADCMYVTVQKEVAQRMTAEPANSHYGTLSILLAATGEVKMERVLKPTVFWPQPQVDSAMVSFIRNPIKVERIRDMQILTQVVSLFMGHRRKMLKACAKLATDDLASIHNWPVVFQDCFIDPHRRPDELEVSDYVAIANLCAESLKQ
ncbi:MAG: 16S rRNA (adenine(1518)-N(6)/adenine(1519)-N(6))-dimethyltransferase RsmA [Phycisphaerales bacterium]|jgi:16S rRNA (adenine1518-N6/adenine1519-N6)-dimethyltransferase